MKPLWKVINIHMCAYTDTFTHLHLHTYIYMYINIHKYTCMYMCVCVCVCVWEGRGRSVPQDENGAQQLHQVKRMIGGLGNVLFSTCSQTLNAVNLWGQVRTLRGLVLVSGTDGDPPPLSFLSSLSPVCPSKKPPCVDSKRPRVYRHHARMCYHMCAWCRYTRGRFESTHGGVLNVHTEAFF